MVTRQEIQATCDDIVQEFHPLQIILFGSYAYGTPTEDSDVDLLVVMPIPKSEFRNKAVEIRQRIQYRFSMDLLVRSPEEIAYRVSYNDWFLREITEKGELLHGSNTHYNIETPITVPSSVKKEKDCMNPLTLEWVQEVNISFSKTHDLEELLNLIVPTIPAWHLWQPDFKIITAYAVESRYPGDSATADNTQHAMHICDAARQSVRMQLNLPKHGD